MNREHLRSLFWNFAEIIDPRLGAEPASRPEGSDPFDRDDRRRALYDKIEELVDTICNDILGGI